MYKGLIVKVVIPALNEADSIGPVLGDIPDWVDQIIVADNGSTDDTARIASAAGATVVHQPRRGYGNACLAGLAAIDFCDVLVFLDADYSDYPEEMERLLEPIAAGRADMVLGARTAAGRQAGALTPPQRFGTALACHLMRIFWAANYSDMGPFRAIRFSSLQVLKMSDPTYGWTVEMQIKALLVGLRISEVPVSYRRRVGRSKISGTVRGIIGAGTKILGTIGRYVLARPRVSSANPDRLIIFTRYPLPGKSKTRLIPAIGPLAAAQLQRSMVRQTLQTARTLCPNRQLEIEIRYCGADRQRIRRWLGPGLLLQRQCSGNLGRRMHQAIGQAFDSGCRRVVLIGTDVPDCKAKHLTQAFEALGGHDLVLGPTTDGGYWLVGMSKQAKIFEHITWSSDAVLQQTVIRADQLHLSRHLLKPLSDVDRQDDLDLLQPGLLTKQPLISVIIPALNEAQRIEAAIRSARRDRVEIIVVDGQSSDQTVPRARDLQAKVICCQPCRARQMNAGAKLAKGKWLIFLHADSTLPPEYQTAIFDAFSDQRIVGGAFELKSDSPGLALSVINWLVALRTRYFQLPYGDQAIFVRKEVFERVGGFAQVSICEDLLLVRQLRRSGRLATVRPAVITSARRWRRLGLLRTVLINQIIVAGCCLSISPHYLQRLYRNGR